MRQSLWMGIFPLFLIAANAYAQQVPGPADAGRIVPEERSLNSEEKETGGVPPSVQAPVAEDIPEEAKSIRFVLREVRIEGVTAFHQERFQDLYKERLGKEVGLDELWRAANAITNTYRQEGYFLSRAFLPEQDIEDGIVTIRMVEGYIGVIALDGEVGEHAVVHDLREALLAEKPVSIQTLESFLLRLNDLPGFSFRAVVEPQEGGAQGAVALNLLPVEKAGRGSVQYNNFGSRFIGPHQVSGAYTASILPLQNTTVSAAMTVPADELKYLSASHTVPLAPEWEGTVSANYVNSHPGHTLEPRDIKSNALEGSVAVRYKPIRQWRENLALEAELQAKNTDTDIGDTPLVRDRIRTIRAAADYERADRWGGANLVNVQLTQGIDAFGASDAGDTDVSRARAKPDFTKLEAAVSRRQGLPGELLLIGSVEAQVASGALYSSEEFGYGGQAFGRAYDPSELLGDDGVSASLELRYTGLPEWREFSFTPFAFYDIGKIWNDDPGQPAEESASSMGIGLYASDKNGFSGSLGVAQPLTRRVDAPQYGNGKNPRVLLKLAKEF